MQARSFLLGICSLPLCNSRAIRTKKVIEFTFTSRACPFGNEARKRSPAVRRVAKDHLISIDALRHAFSVPYPLTRHKAYWRASCLAQIVRVARLRVAKRGRIACEIFVAVRLAGAKA